ncbi:DNA polymerase III subunit delta [Chitinimonas lacunae]|uniref:DNA polymerase III subunit delta n=1 Tax=Chitinimonas lacunae TaxID=1963018 RepID=A0ABV8MT05_9NEIS
MPLRPAELAGHLAGGQLAPIYLVHGEEALVVLETVQTLRDAARAAGCSEREVLTVEPGFSWSQLAHLAASGSLFAERKLIELRLPSGKPGNEGSEALVHYAARPSPDDVLLIQCPKLDRTQTQSKWFGALSEAGVAIACPSVGRHELPGWIAERLKRQQQRLSPEALEFLTARVEGNLLAAKQEIDKLALLHPPGELSLADLRTEIADVARYDVWGVGEAVVAGDPARLVRMLDGLRAEGEAPNLVLWAMAEEARSLYKVGSGRRQGLPLPQLFKEHRVWGERQRHYGPALDRLSPAQLKLALAQAAEIDRMIKGVGQGDVWEALLQLGLRLMGRQRTR